MSFIAIAFLRSAIAEPFARPVVELRRDPIAVVLLTCFMLWPLGRYCRMSPKEVVELCSWRDL